MAYDVHHVHEGTSMKQAKPAAKQLRRGSRKVVVRKAKVALTKRAVTVADRSRWMAETQIKLGSVLVDVERVSVAAARTEMAGLIRASAQSGRAFLIHNAKNASAASALLIDPGVLEQRLLAAVAPRTLGQLIDTLPFKRRGSPRLVVNRPDDFAPARRVAGQLHPVRQAKAQEVSYDVANETAD
jgi:hypothetical protein